MERFLSYNCIIFVTGLLSVVLLLFVPKDNFLYGISQSYFAGFVFWVLVVYIPEVRHRNAVYSFMVNRYREFRLDMIKTFLSAAGIVGYSNIEELLDPEKFKIFFSQKTNKCKTDLLCVAESGIDENPGFLDQIKVSFKHFTDDIDFALNKIISNDPRMYLELCFLKRRLYDLFSLPCYKGDYSKYIGQFFWNTLGWWSEVYGDREVDWIAGAIEKLRR